MQHSHFAYHEDAFNINCATTAGTSGYFSFQCNCNANCWRWEQITANFNYLRRTQANLTCIWNYTAQIIIYCTCVHISRSTEYILNMNSMFVSEDVILQLSIYAFLWINKLTRKVIIKYWQSKYVKIDFICTLTSCRRDITYHFGLATKKLSTNTSYFFIVHNEKQFHRHIKFCASNAFALSC